MHPLWRVFELLASTQRPQSIFRPRKATRQENITSIYVFITPRIMLDPSSQLRHELEHSIEAIPGPRRPILSHLNADTTWLLSLPRDTDCPPGRCRFNILLDPWLRGPQSDVRAWFSTQWHKIPGSVQTIQELNESIWIREDLELRALDRGSGESSADSSTSALTAGNYIDAVICSHEFTDHCHRQTLEEVDSSVPCFATSKAAEIIRSWNHFEQVFDVLSFGKGSNDWRKTSAPSLPAWIGIARMTSGESDVLYYHSAIAIFWHEPPSRNGNGAEVVLYAPHGIHPDALDSISTAAPPVQTLALLHGLHDVKLFSKQLNLGLWNALKCYQSLRPRYWTSSHDEVKVGGGIIAPFLRRKQYTLGDALKAQQTDHKGAEISADEINFVELASGEMLFLN